MSSSEQLSTLHHHHKISLIARYNSSYFAAHSHFSFGPGLHCQQEKSFALHGCGRKYAD
jgi:hypothetical protein